MKWWKKLLKKCFYFWTENKKESIIMIKIIKQLNNKKMKIKKDIMPLTRDQSKVLGGSNFTLELASDIISS